MKVKLRIFAIATVGFLVGCSGGINPDRYLANKQAYMMSQGNPPTYVAGYIDGCSSGRRLAGDKSFAFRKNNTRFDSDALYARGWQEGELNCRNEALQERLCATESPDNQAIPMEDCSVEREKRSLDPEMRKVWDELKK